MAFGNRVEDGNLRGYIRATKTFNGRYHQPIVIPFHSLLVSTNKHNFQHEIHSSMYGARHQHVVLRRRSSAGKHLAPPSGPYADRSLPRTPLVQASQASNFQTASQATSASGHQLLALVVPP